MFEFGKLYKCSNYHPFVYPTFKSIAIADNLMDATTCATYGYRSSSRYPDHPYRLEVEAATLVKFLSQFLGPLKLNIHFVNEPMLFIKTVKHDGEIMTKIISRNKIGWIMCRNWLSFDKIGL